MSDYFITRFPDPILEPGVDLESCLPQVILSEDRNRFDFWAIDCTDPQGELPAWGCMDDSDIPLTHSESDRLLFPFQNSVVRCGNALLREIPKDQSEQLLSMYGAGQGKTPRVFVLDMSAYAWTHTQKDVRSFAIVNVAREAGIRHLALWTAGNAALSLAMAVNIQNAILPIENRIQVHALVHRVTSPQIVHTLESYGAIVTEIAQYQPLTKSDVYENVCKTYKVHGSTVGDIEPSNYWDVTDGLDSVGVLMYRLLCAQVVRFVEPDYLVAPCGTGSIFAGAYQAVRDVSAVRDKCCVIGAVPHGLHPLRAIVSGRLVIDFKGKYANTKEWPVAPKTAVAHTALGPFLRSLVEGRHFSRQWLVNQEKRVSFVEIPNKEQAAAAVALSPNGSGVSRPMAYEPSGLVQLAALPHVVTKYKTNNDSKVLLINTGCGIMAEHEHEFIASLPRRL